MPVSKKYLADFNEKCSYHVYNRTNNKESLFRNDENYKYFLNKYEEYLSGYVDTLGLNLLKNHFHFEIRIKPESEIRKQIESTPYRFRSKTERRYIENRCSISKLIIDAFKRFFQAYAQAFNKMFDRKGNLFHKCFKRILLEMNEDIIRTLIYIHRNPIKHRIATDFTSYPWSSWETHVSGKNIGVACCDVMEYFGNLEHFTRLHHELSDEEIEEDKIET